MPRRLALAVLVLLLLPSAAQNNAERLQWFKEARFGMFIHWGVYSIPARGEWVMHNEKIPIPDYEKFSGQFNPQHFDADAWVQLARDAGCRYMVLTTKHHDGYCMFDSKLTSYDSMDTAPHRDFVKEYVDACHRHGMKVGFYHSLLDWHHPEYAPGRPGGNGDLDKYREYLFGQVRELLTNYGEINVFWFDGGWEHSAADWHSTELLDLIYQLQPGIVVNDRSGLPADYSTPEQTIPDAGMGDRLWETCMTINGNWGYARNDHNWKPVGTLLSNLCDIASKGGNFLLNVGPTEDGVIPQESQDRLRAMGAWLRANGEAVYGTVAGPFAGRQTWGAVTRRDDTLYLLLDQSAGEVLTLDRLKTKIKDATYLTSGRPVAHGEAVGAHVFRVTPGADPVTAVKLVLDGPPEVDRSVHAAADGSFTLPARLAQVDGGHARYESGDGRDNIGYWTDSGDTVSWEVQVERGGVYTVALDYASEVEGAEFQVTNSVAKVTGKVARTGGWKSFVTVVLGPWPLPAGLQTITVRPTKMPGFAVMNLRSIVLTPAE
ncbi:MAG: alpha-L-fucosidase [Armatimonadetes bacterium]|nr:alpha-L-fucosidase [Armatimonadota bacterium]